MSNVVRQYSGLPPADPARNAKIDFRLTNHQKAAWTKAAVSNGYEISEWIRASLDQKSKEANADIGERRLTLVSNAGAAICGIEERIGIDGSTWLHDDLRRIKTYLKSLEGLL